MRARGGKSVRVGGIPAIFSGVNEKIWVFQAVIRADGIEEEINVLNSSKKNKSLIALHWL